MHIIIPDTPSNKKHMNGCRMPLFIISIFLNVLTNAFSSGYSSPVSANTQISCIANYFF